MRALALTSFDGPAGFELIELPDPEPGDDVLIDVQAAGVSFPDLLISRNSYQVKVELPYVAGQEVAGTIRSAPADSELRPGDRVWASLPAGGGLATIARVPARTVDRLPDSLSFEQGAALGVNFTTATFALGMRCPVSAGETVLVLGAAGGLGTALVAVAQQLGARVVAHVSTEEKREIAMRAGADEVIVGPSFRDRALELTGGLGVDVVADVVGGEATLEAVRSCAPAGRVLILGFASGAIGQIGVNRLLLRNVSLVGAGLGAMDQADPRTLPAVSAALIGMLEQGLRPIVGASFSFADGAQALAALEGRRAMGKLVLVP
jgi:NADPH:quinone reductase